MQLNQTHSLFTGGAIAVAAMAGISSPIVPLIAAAYPLWMPFFIPSIPQFIIFGSFLFVSTTILCLALVASGLYERIFVGERNPDALSPRVAFLIASVVLSLPSFVR